MTAILFLSEATVLLTMNPALLRGCADALVTLRLILAISALRIWERLGMTKSFHDGEWGFKYEKKNAKYLNFLDLVGGLQNGYSRSSCFPALSLAPTIPSGS